MKKIIVLLVIAIGFHSCNKEGQLSKEEKTEYIAEGKKIGKATLQKLGGNLMKEMKSGGPLKAIPFCNINANNLTNEVAKIYNVRIKRTSHKLRNPKNAPNKSEAEIINQYLSQIEKGAKLKPQLVKDNVGEIHFYAPIKMEAKCIVCHGDVVEGINTKIKSLYPNDKATGFKINDLRGILSVTFE